MDGHPQGLSLESLATALRDDETSVWVEAGRELGRRALTDEQARSYLMELLTDHPPVGTENGGDTHTFRRACCALGSFVSQPDADVDLFQPLLKEHVEELLRNVCMRRIEKAGTVAQLCSLPGMEQLFRQWHAEQLDKTRSLIQKFQHAGNQRALQENERYLAELQESEGGSSVPQRFTRRFLNVHGEAGWRLAAYLMGVASPRGLLGLPLLLLAESLLDLGQERGADGLAFVAALPALLHQLEGKVDAEVWRAAAERLFASVSPAWAANAVGYNEYVLGLAGLCEAPAFVDMWTGGVAVPEPLRAGIGSIVLLARSEPDPARASAACARLMRRIAGEYFHDDWMWEELEPGERFSLNIYLFLLVHGPQALASPGGCPVPAPAEHPLDLNHRLALLDDAIQSASRASVHLLPSLVRALQLLLGQELRQTPGGDKLRPICTRQILLVRPLVERWHLPVTLRKDLAIIVGRALAAIYREDQDEFLDLLYTVLFAFPDDLLLREMSEHTGSPRLRPLFRETRQLIHRLEGASGSHGEAVDTAGILRCYNDYVRLLTDTCRLAEKGLQWLSRLPSALALIGRVADGGAQLSPREKRECFEAMRHVLLLRHRSRRPWQSVMTPVRGRDARGLLEERQERERQEGLEADSDRDALRLLADDVLALESDCLPEAGGTAVREGLVQKWQALIGQLTGLRKACSEKLPYVERQACTTLLHARVREMNSRLGRVVQIVGQEREEEAVRLVSGNGSGSHPQEGNPGKPPLQPADADLLRDWMVDRYMLRELADAYKIRPLQLLSSPSVVAAVVFLPIVACIILHRAGAASWQGVPFALVGLLNLAVVGWFWSYARRPALRGRLRASVWRFLLPQTTAALFVGITQTLHSDESWSLAVGGAPLVRILMWLAYLFAGFLFTREILLEGQLRESADRKKKGDRARALMALSMWQCFTLVLFFSLVMGPIMAGGHRADIDPAAVAASARPLSDWLPVAVYLGPRIIQPATEATACFPIYPWALLTWTVQIFFFSAIFERIMGTTRG